MPSLIPNLVKRVQRLPKPTTAAEAMQPLFEAVSNSVQAVNEKYDTDTERHGLIKITCSTSRSKTSVSSVVEDNGPGLNSKNFEAFCTTDTDNKIVAGGKGVGRLLWLDAFTNISVSSTYEETPGKYQRRSFDFVLSNDEQIRNYRNVKVRSKESGFVVNFGNLKEGEYRRKYPGRKTYIFQHFLSHFLPLFVGGRCPRIEFTCDEEKKVYPKAVDEIIEEKETIENIKTKDYGLVRLILMKAEKSASANLKGSHFVHFIGHGRTVKSQKIDGKLGLKFIGDKQLVFHACLFGEYFDRHVNQERTDFTFGEQTLEDVVGKVCMPYIEKFLSAPLKKHKSDQKKVLETIVSKYPSVAFGSADELQKHVPLGELENDALYGHLSRERFRRDERQDEKILNALNRLRGDDVKIKDFGTALKEASAAVEDQEKKSLAEYIIRRRLVLDFISTLLKKVRTDVTDSSYQAEDILHNFICPMRVSTISSSSNMVEAASSHDLWIIDERLTFAQYFSSDVSFDKIAKEYDSGKRPDLLIFDRVHGLKENDDNSKILLIEFKKPGRSQYQEKDNPHIQIQEYIRKLQSGAQTDVNGRPIRVDSNTIFYCYLIADRLGKLEDFTYSWSDTTDGRGKIYQSQGGFKGFIELVEWDALLSDARARNAAFFDRIGTHRGGKVG